MSDWRYKIGHIVIVQDTPNSDVWRGYLDVEVKTEDGYSARRTLAEMDNASWPTVILAYLSTQAEQQDVWVQRVTIRNSHEVFA